MLDAAEGLLKVEVSITETSVGAAIEGGNLQNYHGTVFIIQYGNISLGRVLQC